VHIVYNMRPSDPLREIERKSAEVLTTEALRAHVVSGALHAGSKVTETDLADRLGVSRITVRAALQKVASEGLVRQLPYRGWVIAGLSRADIWELTTMRATLEGMAVGLVLELPAATRRAAIRPLLSDLVAACSQNDRALIADADFLFHAGLIVLASHQRLREHYQLVELQIRRYIAVVNDELSIREIQAQHELIAKAILGGRSTAKFLIEEHSTSEGQRLQQMIVDTTELPA
jgi:DNA-binding GntR family transcriptional regulator